MYVCPFACMHAPRLRRRLPPLLCSTNEPYSSRLGSECHRQSDDDDDEASLLIRSSKGDRILLRQRSSRYQRRDKNEKR